MKKIGLIFGGKSVEHDVSIITAMQCYNWVNPHFDVQLIYIDKQNNLFLMPKNTTLESFKTGQKLLKSATKINLIEHGFKACLKKVKLDCVINCCHGGIGENGILAGILEFYDIVQTASSQAASAICMNKNYAKKIASATDIAVPKATLITSMKILDSVIAEFDFPVIVKPNNLGSSIGVKKCNDLTEVMEAAATALTMDNEVLIEECIGSLIEYNCAVYKHNSDIILSDIEQPVGKDEVLSFKDKYLNQPHEGMKSTQRIFPADISDELKLEIEQTTIKLYKTLDLSGVVRIDYLYDSKNEKLYFNEINTIPGSLATYLFVNKNILHLELLEDLIEQAILENNINKIINSYFESDILKKM